MAVTAAAYVVGGLVYVLYVDNYYSKLALRLKTENLL
jgi:hypothetical protein